VQGTNNSTEMTTAADKLDKLMEAVKVLSGRQLGQLTAGKFKKRFNKPEEEMMAW